MYFGKRFRKFSFILSMIASFLATLIPVLYTLLVFTNVLGVISATLMSLANFYMSGMIIYNTTLKQQEIPKATAEMLQKQETKAKIFLVVTILCIILNTTSIFLSSLLSMLLLGAALAFIPSDVVLGVALAVAIIGTLAALTYSIIQTYEVMRSIKMLPVEDELINDSTAPMAKISVIEGNVKHEEIKSAVPVVTTSKVLVSTLARGEGLFAMGPSQENGQTLLSGLCERQRSYSV